MVSKIKRNGFTLVELVVVILIIAILATATFLGGATVIKQARLSKVQSNLSNYATYVQDMLYAEPGVANKDAAGAETLLNNKYLTKDFQLGDMKDSWGNNYNFKFATGTVDNVDSKTHKCTYAIINSNGANGRDESADVTTVLSGADYVSAQDAVDTATLTTGDDIGVIIILRDGAVSTAYYGNKGEKGNNTESKPDAPELTVLTAPENVNITGSTLSWNTVENATSYTIYKDGQVVAENIVVPTYIIGALKEPGTHTYSVMAIGDGTNYSDSNTSNNASIEIAGLYQTGHAGDNAYLVNTWTEIVNTYDGFWEGNIYGSMGDEIMPEAHSYLTDLSGDLVIPNTITSIDTYAFMGCTELTSVIVPNTVGTINGFQYSGINSIEIQNASTSIGDNVFGGVFAGTDNLSTIIFKGTKAQWQNAIEEKVTGIGSGVTVKCTDGDITV